MIPSSEISFQTLTVCAPIFNTLLGVLSRRKRATFMVLPKQMALQVLLDFWGPNDGLQEREIIFTCWIRTQIFWIAGFSFHRTFHEASYCIVSNKQLSLWTDWMSDWTILCLSIKAPASMMLLATKQQRVLMSALTWIYQITLFDNCKFQMPSSEPQVWSAINTRTSHHLMLLEKVLPFFKIVAFVPHTSL